MRAYCEVPGDVGVSTVLGNKNEMRLSCIVYKFVIQRGDPVSKSAFPDDNPGTSRRASPAYFPFNPQSVSSQPINNILTEVRVLMAKG